MKEVWKDVEGFNYEVSNIGRVRNKKVGSIKKTFRKGGRKGKDYYVVCLSRKGKPHTKLVHRVVAEAFLGPCPEGLEVDHKDAHKENNCIDNLEYVTRKENLRRSVLMGLGKRGGLPKGNIPWNKGLTQETSEYFLGGRPDDFEFTEESKEKMSKSLKKHYETETVWNKGKTKDSDPRVKGWEMGKKRGTTWNKGKKGVSEETQQKMKEAAKKRHARISKEDRKKLTSNANKAARRVPNINKEKKLKRHVKSKDSENKT